MANQKSCSGLQVVTGWTAPASSCIYQLTLTIDLTPITNTVAVNNGMTDGQIAALLNANRTGNTSGTISVQTVGADLHITISGAVLQSGAPGLFDYTISGTGFPCGDFPVHLPTPMTCSLIPNRPRKSGAFAYGVSGDTFCLPTKDRFGRPVSCPDRISAGFSTYVKTSTDGRSCCYKKIN